jgi:hypothetical protein
LLRATGRHDLFSGCWLVKEGPLLLLRLVLCGPEITAGMV